MLAQERLAKIGEGGPAGGAEKEKEGYHEDREHEEGAGGAVVCQRRRSLGGGGASGSTRRRDLLLLGAHDRRLLPAELRVPPGAPRECPLPRHAAGGGSGWLPALPAVPPARAGAGRTAGGRGGEGVPADRNGRGHAESRLARRGGRDEPVLFPPGLPSHHWRHPQGVRGRPSRATGPRRARAAADGDGRALRGRVQFQRPVLRRLRGDSRYDPHGLSRRGSGDHHPLRRRRVLARIDPGGRHRQGRVRDFAR